MLDPARRTALVDMAARQGRPAVDLLNDAVDALISADHRQRAEIGRAMREADAGDFATADEVAAAFAPR
jgi:predicted transcriptional regulator